MKNNKEAFDAIRAELIQYDLESVSEASGVHVSTLYSWITKRHCAQFKTLIKVAHVLGYKIELKISKI